MEPCRKGKFKGDPREECSHLDAEKPFQEHEEDCLPTTELPGRSRRRGKNMRDVAIPYGKQIAAAAVMVSRLRARDRSGSPDRRAIGFSLRKASCQAKIRPPDRLPMEQVALRRSKLGEQGCEGGHAS